MPAKQKSNLDEITPLLFSILRLIQSHLVHANKSNEEISSPVQWHTLHFIKDRKNPLMKDLADHLSITPPSATSLIDGLVESKMLKRDFDKHDRRAVRLVITAKGDKAIQKGFNHMSEQIKKIFACLDKKEQKQLISIYKKILNSLTK